jgi:hypothetical protein
MPRNRTNILVRTPTAAEPKEAKKSTSMFLITINPNKVFHNLDTPEAKKMIAQLTALGDFILKKRNIKAALTFKDRPAKLGETPIKLDREQHLSKIVSISQDRSAAVEIGSQFKKLHLHIEFIIEHRTFIHLNKPFILDLASIFTGIPKEKIHVNLRGATRAEGYKGYVQKNAAENAPHFLDKSAQTFYKE